MTRLRRLLLIAPLAAFFAVALVACGGGGGGSDEDPQKVLDETFSGGKDYSKGVVDLSFKVAAEGDQAGSLDATVKGPFQGEKGAFPRFGFDADVSLEGSGQNTSFQGGLLSTGDSAFVNYQDADYQIDAPTFDNFKQLYVSLQGQSTDQAGNSTLDPSGFLIDLKNDGTEDIEGEESIHISGKADINKLVDQVKAAPGAADQPGTAQLDQLKTAVTSANFNVYSGKDDKRLRKIDADLVFEPPPDQTGGNAETINVQFSLTFSSLGEEQTVTAPTSSQPLAVLLKKYGLDASSLGQAFGAASGQTGADSGASAPSDAQSAEYLQCLSQAKGEAATQACAELLQ